MRLLWSFAIAVEVALGLHTALHVPRATTVIVGFVAWALTYGIMEGWQQMKLERLRAREIKLARQAHEQEVERDEWIRLRVQREHQNQLDRELDSD